MEYALLSKNGDRELNEDYIGYKVNCSKGCFVLADGLGGHSKGEVASETVTEEVLHAYEEANSSADGESVAAYFQQAQERLLTVQAEAACQNEMLSTLCILCISEKGISMGHVGDSRIYHFTDGKLVRRTMDHSVPQMLVAAGEIRESEIRGHQDRNRLLRAMGAEWNREAYTIIEDIPYRAGQQFLLCSDGFWELVYEKQMVSTLRKSDNPQMWLDKMEKIVLKNGKHKDMDNYSAIAVWI